MLDSGRGMWIVDMGCMGLKWGEGAERCWIGGKGWLVLGMSAQNLSTLNPIQVGGGGGGGGTEKCC